MKRTNTFILACLLSVGYVHAQDESFTFSSSYIGDGVASLSGGLSQKSTYLGYATIGINFNTEKADLWNGGKFFISGGNTHGGMPSEEFLGDRNIVDNIEAGNHTFLKEFWFKQTLRNMSIGIGLQDFNTNFATSDESCLYLNSVQGINAVFSNVAPPIFPITALGFEFTWNINDQAHWQTCIYDGAVDDFSDNPYNTKWSLSQNDGALICSEFHWNIGENSLYKIGGFYHTNQNSSGFYLIGDQHINNIALFEQIAFTPNTLNDSNMQISGGINVYGNKNNENVLGFAFVYNKLNNERKHESIAEITYKYQTKHSFYFQPDIQYVINPAGTDEKLDNALIGLLRFGWEI